MSATRTGAVWFHCVKPDPAARVRLICFPPSGGAPSAYRTWPQTFHGLAEVYALNLPGRGARMAEAPCTDLVALVEVLSEALTPLLDRPLVFWGHSLGALVSYELARAMRRRQYSGPAHLVVGGLNAPDIANTMPIMHTLPDNEFIERLRHYDGTPEELLRHRELLELMLPPLRADFMMCETYRHQPQPPLACPITATGGTDDPTTTVAGIEAWREHTSAACTVHMLPGGHFFPRDSECALFAILRTVLGSPAATCTP